MQQLYDSDYLLKTLNVTKNIKSRSYQLLHLENGQKILDLGCGNGYDTIEIAKIAGHKSLVVGLDHDANMLKTAKDIRAQTNLTNIEYVLSEASCIPFENNTFDAIRIERVFQHLEDSFTVMHEVERVLKPNGRLVIIETDWMGLSLLVEETVIERKIIKYLTDKFIKNGHASRNLIKYLEQYQFANIELDTATIPIENFQVADEYIKLSKISQNAYNDLAITEDEYNRWTSLINKYQSNNYFKGSISIITVSSIKKA